MAFWSIGHILNKIFDSATSALGVKVTGSSVAHDAPSTANPILSGFVAESTIPAAVADGDLSQVAGTLYGAPFVNPVTSAGAQITGATGAAVPAGASLIGIKGASGNLVAPLDGPTGQGTAGAGITGVIPMIHDNVGLVYNRLSGVRGAADGAVGSDYLPAAGMGLNSSGAYDRWRNNTEGTLLASAARTAGVGSAVQTNHNARGVQVTLSITAASGTGGLYVQVYAIDPISGSTYQLTVNSTPIVATGRYTYELYPGASGSAVGGANSVVQRTAGVLPRTWSVSVVAGDGSSYTYSVGYSLVV